MNNSLLVNRIKRLREDIELKVVSTASFLTEYYPGAIPEVDTDHGTTYGTKVIVSVDGDDYHIILDRNKAWLPHDLLVQQEDIKPIYPSLEEFLSDLCHKLALKKLDKVDTEEQAVFEINTWKKTYQDEVR